MGIHQKCLMLAYCHLKIYILLCKFDRHIFEGVIALFHSLEYLIKKDFAHNTSFIVNRNSLKMFMLAYCNMKICILLWKFYWNILMGYCPFSFTRIFYQKDFTHNTSFIVNGNSSKMFNVCSFNCHMKICILFLFIY